MPLLNIILRCCWLEILPSQSLALSQFVKKRTLMTGVSATPDLQPFLANAHCGRLHGVSLPTTLSHAQLAEGSLVCAIILDTLGILHSWRIIRSSVQANHCFFFFFWWAVLLLIMLTAQQLHPHDNKQISGKKQTRAPTCAFLSGFPATSQLIIVCLKFSFSTIAEFSNQNPVIDSQWPESSCRLIFNNCTTWKITQNKE